MYGDFHTQSIIHHFQEIIDPFFNDNIPIRTWAHVEWSAQSDINHKLKEFEDSADCTVNEAGLVSVCAYPADSLTVSLYMNLMRNHEYLMTDKELIRSNLYKHSKKSVIFPSLSVQSKLQSEIDLYKQKLDFVHVVSHEVRNPLTVIRAYCSVIMEQESGLNEENLVRIRDIRDYVDVIDHEMNHIIQTEQMLSKDLLWKKEIVDPLPVIWDVIDFMSIKARTQHQTLQETLNLNGSEKILANKIGLKLVLSNLLSNAIKYSEEQSIIAFAVFSNHDTLIIKVKDQGIGMSNAQINELFEKYGKVNPDKSGSGIGLYMVKKLVDQFNGFIHIDSQLGKGTDITVELPLTI
jgi:signal transduction histidine kinase